MGIVIPDRSITRRGVGVERAGSVACSTGAGTASAGAVTGTEGVGTEGIGTGSAATGCAGGSTGGMYWPGVQSVGLTHGVGFAHGLGFADGTCFACAIKLGLFFRIAGFTGSS
jgi:hypothetical protein